MPDLLPILDTHQHLVYSDQWPYSWTGGIPALAGKAFRYDDYRRATAGAGVAASIFMETTPDFPHWKNEARFVYGLCRQAGSTIKGVIANGQLESPDFPAYLDSIRDSKLLGVRRILHVEPDELSTTKVFADNVRLLGKMNLTFDLCVRARQIPLAIELVHKCPGVQFILDHCGNPDIAADHGRGPAKQWRDAIKSIAKIETVACKISGIVANCLPDTASAQLLRPYVEHCLEHFGSNDVVWGGDWPVCLTRSTLADWIAFSREIVAGAPLEDQRKLFMENAVRIYRVNFS